MGVKRLFGRCRDQMLSGKRLAFMLIVSALVSIPWVYGCHGRQASVVYIAAGEHNSFALTDGGELYAWGLNAEGALGIGTSEDTAQPTRVLLEERVTQVVPGAFAVALTEDGEVYTWGVTRFGILEFGSNLFSAAPTRVDLPEKIVRLGAGNSLGLAISESGSLYMWGWNYYGQRGDGTRETSFTPHKVDLPGRVVDASGVDSHVMALLEDGTVYAWGSNFFGEIGDGQPVINQPGEELIEVTVLSPYRVPFETRIVAIATGRGASYALDEAGNVYSFGANDVGQLGVGGGVWASSTPTRVAIPGMVRIIVSGNFHALAVTEDGTLYGWGRNSRGGGSSVLGIGSTEEVVYEPRAIGALGEITAISAGNGLTWVLTKDNGIYGWGHNGSGQIQAGLPNNVDTPTQVVLDLGG